MAIKVNVPSPGESITEVQLASWLVQDGDFVEKDQDIAEIDSDKATLTISAGESGKIAIRVEEGATVQVDDVIAEIDTHAKGAPKKAKKEDAGKETPEKGNAPAGQDKTAPPPQPAAKQKEGADAGKAAPPDMNISPLARRLMKEKDVTDQDLAGFFRNYRLGKEDVEFYLKHKDNRQPGPPAGTPPEHREGSRETERKKMSTLRMKVAGRLVAVRNETAMLTTFNEVNMTPVVDIRKKYKEAFREKYGVNLGFMSFFTRAITEALQHFPEVNASIDGNEIIYHKYADIGIAVSSPKGLMVPVLRNAEKLSLAEIESGIKELATRARENKITLDEMKGGTFTITNGGVFGSMLSTPIINPPQSAILGMHNIVERPIAIGGKVEIHPVMYVALSYDHRIIDGKESVSFLVRVKEMLENPTRMLFQGRDPVLDLLGL
ncbi:MAG: 2-oxoglutarate dehydrogenase complex dihydrolipoyllysine-residue succinyltransferase [Bacteroidales bacterium]